MTNQEISRKIKIIKENYVNGNINSEDMMDHLDDLCCELEECEGAFGIVSELISSAKRLSNNEGILSRTPAIGSSITWISALLLVILLLSFS